MNALVLVPTPWHTDARPLWLRALESRLIFQRQRCTGTTLERRRCAGRAYFLTESGESRCGQHRNGAGRK